MAKVHGRKTVFTLTDIDGSEQDMSNFLNTVDFPVAVDVAEVSGFGDTDKTYLVGLRSHTLRIQGNTGYGADEPDDVLFNLAGGGADGTVKSTYKYGPNGSASGEVQYTGECWVTNYAPSSPLNGASTFSADFQTDGSATRTTW